jgi:hypothetical protein
MSGEGAPLPPTPRPEDLPTGPNFGHGPAFGVAPDFGDDLFGGDPSPVSAPPVEDLPFAAYRRHQAAPPPLNPFAYSGVRTLGDTGRTFHLEQAGLGPVGGRKKDNVGTPDLITPNPNLQPDPGAGVNPNVADTYARIAPPERTVGLTWVPGIRNLREGMLATFFGNPRNMGELRRRQRIGILASTLGRVARGERNKLAVEAAGTQRARDWSTERARGARDYTMGAPGSPAIPRFAHAPFRYAHNVISDPYRSRGAKLGAAVLGLTGFVTAPLGYALAPVRRALRR